MNTSNEMNIQDKKKTIEEIYQRRLEILSNPTAYTQKITEFSAGGLGACAYGKYVSVAELAYCWEFDEFKFLCSECGETAYIYQFAGHVNGGGYWELNAFCPKCHKHLHFSRRDFNPVKIHWSALKRIADTVSKQIQEIKGETDTNKHEGLNGERNNHKHDTVQRED